VNPNDSYMHRPPPTPTTYYSGSQSSSTPQTAQFPAYSAPSPVQQSPMSAVPLGPRIPSGQSSILQPSPSHNMVQYPRPYNGYSMPGPVMTNIHNPSNQMSLVAGMTGMMPAFNSGQAAHMQQMYASQPQTPQNDRPFKCDQCPQSFNRNHDLKRHKRIHLAVKPFPCGHCEKSFSRKDALKRHILVKGCGKALGSRPLGADSESMDLKSELMSSDNDNDGDDSPR